MTSRGFRSAMSVMKRSTGPTAPAGVSTVIAAGVGGIRSGRATAADTRTGRRPACDLAQRAPRCEIGGDPDDREAAARPPTPSARQRRRRPAVRAGGRTVREVSSRAVLFGTGIDHGPSLASRPLDGDDDNMCVDCESAVTSRHPDGAPQSPRLDRVDRGGTDSEPSRRQHRSRGIHVRTDVRRPPAPSRRPAPAAALRLRRLRRAVASAEDAGVDIVFNWDHFYPLERAGRRRALRVLDDARRLGRADLAGRDRRAGHLQQLSQSRAAGRHGPHRRPHQ